MNENRLLQLKKFGNISSLNFTSKAFNDRVWDEQTTKARGLYIDTFKGRIAARAYDKFFNINERPETKFDMLQHKLQFPVTAYVKENNVSFVFECVDMKHDPHIIEYPESSLA